MRKFVMLCVACQMLMGCGSPARKEKEPKPEVKPEQETKMQVAGPRQFELVQSIEWDGKNPWVTHGARLIKDHKGREYLVVYSEHNGDCEISVMPINLRINSDK